MNFFSFISFFCLFNVSTNALAEKTSVDKISATVENEIILQSEVKQFPNRLKKEFAIDDTLLLGQPVSTLKESKKEQLNFLIRERIVDSEIKRLSLNASNETVDKEFLQMAKRNQMSSDQFIQFLEKEGFTTEDYKKGLRARIERQAFFEREIISKLRITDEDAYGVYQTKFPNSKPQVGEFQVAQIFFSNKKGGKESALERASATYKKFQGGDSFESLANQVDESGANNKDGVLGTFKSGEFVPAIEKAISDLSINGVSKVIAGPSGFHIVKLLAKTTVPDPNFARVKESIKAGLVQQSFGRQLKNWFDLKTLEAHIKIYDESL